MAVAAAVVAAAGAGACRDVPDDVVRPPTAGAIPGGVLRVAIGPPGSVDPGNAYEPEGALVAATMCDSLLATDPATGRLRPGLAESWQVSDDGTRISLKLREGATFPSGRAVTPDDVVWSLSRAASAGFAGQAADLLAPVAGFAVIRGFEEADRERDRVALAGVRPITDRSVEIRLSAPGAGFLAVLAHPVAAPLDRVAAEADPARFARRPECAGPYRLAADAPQAAPPAGTVIALERSPGYRGRGEALVAGGAGLADRIEFHVVAAGAGAAAVEAGVVDAAAVPGPRPASLGAEVVEGPSPRVEMLALPQGAAGAFGQRDLRVALSQAVDRERLAAEVHGGARAPATGFVPPAAGSVVHRVGGPPACRDTVPAGADPVGARRTLSQAGIDLGAVPLVLTVNRDPEVNVAVARAVGAQWSETFGITVAVEEVDYDDLLARAGAGTLTGPFRVSWTSAVTGPDQWLRPMFHTGATNLANLGRFTDPAFDRILDEEAAEAGDDDDRRLAFQRAEDRLCREMPAIPLTTDVAHHLVSTARLVLGGPVWVDSGTGTLSLREIAVR